MTGELAAEGRDLIGVDLERPSPARLYDYWLGGSLNTAADREAARKVTAAMPEMVQLIRANRSFLRRVVRHLVVERGITQFLDLGSGIPTVGNVHEIAQGVNPEAKVVYVDLDPVAVTHARYVLAGNRNADAIRADLTDPAVVLSSPVVGELIDFAKPVAVLLVAVLHFVPDERDPAGIVRGYVEHMAPGSYLAISHAANPPDAPMPGRAAALDDYTSATAVPVTLRNRQQVADLFAATELLPPGIVTLDDWLPDSPCATASPDYCGLGMTR
jgi:hypothetical protein